MLKDTNDIKKSYCSKLIYIDKIILQIKVVYIKKYITINYYKRETNYGNIFNTIVPFPT